MNETTTAADSAQDEKPKRKRSRKTEGGTSAPRGKAKAPTLEPAPPQTPPMEADPHSVGQTMPLADVGNEPALNGTQRDATGALHSQKHVYTIHHMECDAIHAAYASDVGQVRANNQDNVTAFVNLIPRGDGQAPFGLFIVADGMGGHEHGEVASMLATRALLQGVVENIYLPALEGHAFGNATDETPTELIERLIEQSNRLVQSEAAAVNSNMGTTLTTAVVVGGSMYIGHVGDSRMYALLRDESGTGVLEQVTQDHSVVARMVQLGQLTPEEALTNPNRSMLYKTIGQRAKAQPDIEFVSLENVTHLLLCSDGLWDMVPDVYIEHILVSAATPAEACQMLLDAANSAGGEDNVTALVVALQK